MEDDEQKTESVMDSAMREKIAGIRQDFDAFFKQFEETVKYPSLENLKIMRDQVFENGEKEFELGSTLSQIINQCEAVDDDEDEDLFDDDFDWADDQEQFVLIEEAFGLLKDSSELLARLKKYRKHILLELDAHDELPRALSGLHDTLLERLEKIADVQYEF